MKQKKLTREERIEQLKKMVEQPGTMVVRGLTLEAQWLIRKIRQYDMDMRFIKSRIGRQNFDDKKAMEIIHKAQEFEEGFKKLLSEMREFVNQYRKNGQRVQAGDNNENETDESLKENKTATK